MRAGPALQFEFDDSESWIQLYTEDDYWLDADPYINSWGVSLTVTMGGGMSTLDIVFDQGVDTGTLGDCLENRTAGLNHADQFMLDQPTTVVSALTWGCFPWNESDEFRVHFWLDDGGLLGSVSAEYDVTPATQQAKVGEPPFLEIYFPKTRIPAGTPMWFGASSNGDDVGQFTIFTPRDGQLARQNGQSGDWTTLAVGDMAFQLISVQDYDPIPAVSEWGMVTMTLLVLTAGTLVFTRRRTAEA